MSLLGPQLDSFLAIVKHKTVHSAADTLFVTQTAVTQRIRALESKLKTSLFIRTRRGMLLSEEGEALLRYCQSAKELEGETLAQIHGAGTELPIHLNISGPSSIMRSRVIPQCISVLHEYPNLFIDFDIDDIEKREQKLRQGSSQLVILMAEAIMPEMSHKKLLPEEYILVCTPEWQKRPLQNIIKKEPIIDFNPSDKSTFHYLEHFNLHQEVRHERHFANRIESLALMISEGIGYSVLTKEFAAAWLEQGKLVSLNNGKIYKHQYFLAYYPRPEMPKYLTKLIDAIA